MSVSNYFVFENAIQTEDYDGIMDRWGLNVTESDCISKWVLS